MRHAGRLEISEKLLLAVFKFEGGRIHFIGYMPEKMAIGIVIEHSDMPEILKQGEIPIVNLGVLDLRYKRFLPKLGWQYRLRSFRDSLLGKFCKLAKILKTEISSGE